MSVLIRSKSDQRHLLEVDLRTGLTGKALKADAASYRKHKGFFHGWSNGYMYVVSGEDGPYLTVGQRHFRFKSPSWRVEVEKGDGENVFRLWDEKVLVIEERYLPAEVDELDPWDDEESVDFFV